MCPHGRIFCVWSDSWYERLEPIMGLQTHTGTWIWVGRVRVQVNSKSPTKNPHPWPGFGRFSQALRSPNITCVTYHYHPPTSIQPQTQQQAQDISLNTTTQRWE